MEALGRAGGCGLCWGGESKHTLRGLSRVCPTLPEQPSGHGYGHGYGHGVNHGVTETCSVVAAGPTVGSLAYVSLCVCVMGFLRRLYMLVHVYVYMLTVPDKGLISGGSS